MLTSLRPEVLDLAAELNRRIRGGTLEEQRTFLTWKYFDNPYLPEPVMHVALHDGRAVGMRGYYGTCWRVGGTGRTHVFPAASDSAILDEYRETGLYAELNSAALEDVARRGFTHVVNLSARPEVALTSMLTFGWKGVVPQDVMTIGASTEPPSRALVRRAVPSKLLPLARRLVRSSRRSSHAFSGTSGVVYRSPTTEVRATISSAELADVARRCSYDERLGLVRDERFIMWRFAKPFVAYRFLIADGDSGCGYLILCRRPNRIPVFILDWKADTVDIQRALLAATLEGLRLPNLSIWSATLTEPELTTLRAMGFVPRVPPSPLDRRRQALLVRPTADPRDDALWEVDGLRLDAAETWSVGAVGSDAY